MSLKNLSAKIKIPKLLQKKLNNKKVNKIYRRFERLINIDESFFFEKEYKFKNLSVSQVFVNNVGEIAEREGHHPDISFGWGYAKIKIFTHSIKGLAESDFVLAAKIDKIN